VRKEITALRSLAVIAVLLYHAKIPYFSSAYLGVDVFFVISGYLITGKILNEINRGTFTITSFYLNRMRRLLPAYFSLAIVVTLFVYLYFFPDDIKNFSQSLSYSVLYISNFFFWADANYFSTAIEFKPLAHTWSLSIEEQFYLLLPVSILLINKINVKYLKNIILLGIVLSFFTTVPSFIESHTKFYLLPFRVWEMLIGSFLIFINKQKKSSERVTFVGLLLILLSFGYSTSNLNHPGYLTLPVILGTSLIILYGGQTKYLDKLFSLRVITDIGLASYSIYLWHYPLFVFNAYFREFYKFEIYNQIHNFLIEILLIFLSLFIGYLSWRFIENYFRYEYKNNKILISVIILFSAIVVFTGLDDTLYKNSKLKYSNFSQIIEPTKTKDKFEKDCLIMEEVKTIDVNKCVGDIQSSKKNILFVGDSLAHNLHNGFISYENSISTSLISATGCPPYLVVGKNNYLSSEKCSSVTNDLDRVIKDNEFDQIFIIANYVNFLKGNIFYENNPNSLQLFKDQIINLPAKQRDKIVIIGQFPVWKNNLPNVLAGQVYTNKILEKYNIDNVDTQIFVIENDIKKWAYLNKIKYISILDILCFEESCLQIVEINKKNYSTSFDSIHFTKEVSIYISKIIESKLYD